MSWRLTVSDGFCAAHALRNYHGKCERVHGHNFGVSISVEGSELDPETGILLDYSTLKRILRHCLESLDHCFLNEIAPFASQNPSSENIARHIWNLAAECLSKDADPQCAKVKLSSVSVAEKPGQEATYLGNS